MTEQDNPYNICAFRPTSECKECSLNDRLKCRYNHRDLLNFIVPSLALIMLAFIGMILAGYGWYIFGEIGFMLFFFNFWETRILCSHCPYYVEKCLTLHCIANYGSLKIWKYNLGLMNKLEKIQFIIGTTVLIGYPFIFLILGKQYILALLIAVGVIMFFWYLRKYTCSKCINFSCLLNSVPKETVDRYLKRNPVMRKAWEEKGWEIEMVNS